MNKLKLYVWNNVLEDYTSGVAFALARSPQQAKELLKGTMTVRKDYKGKEYESWSGIGPERWDGFKLDGQDYECYENPEAQFVYGGG